MIALTFDDGPNEPYTRQILDVLAEYGAKATFFVIGKWVRKAPEIVREVAAAGHEIGNHTDNHVSLSGADYSLTRWEFGRGYEAIHDVIGAWVESYRPPFGQASGHESIAAKLADIDSRIVMWDIHGSDWDADSVEAITEPIFKYLDEHKGGIVLLHDGYYKEFGADRSKTVEATRRILERYKSEKFVTVSEYKQ